MKKKYLGLLSLGVVSMALAATTASIVPTAEGTYLQWTPKSGSTHYTMVDESSCNGTTDYVSTTVTGSRDSYAVSLSSVPNGSTITAITVTPCASKNKSSGSSVMNAFYRLNGTNSADQGAYSLTGTTPTSLVGTTYAGLNVVKNASTSLEVGVVLTSGTAGARLSRVGTVITYLPQAPIAPSNLSGFANSTSTGSSTIIWASLTWTDNSSDENGFAVERGLDGINFTQIATTTANTTLYNNFGVSASTTYYYRVRAYNAGGNSAYATSTTVVFP